MPAMPPRKTFLLAAAGVALVLVVLASRHPYFPLCIGPEAAVADAVGQGDSALLVRACQARILPFRSRREALLGLLEFQGGASTKVVLPGELADAIFREFSGSVPRDALLFLYPALVAGEINPRVKGILLDPSETEIVRWSACLVLLLEPSLLSDASDGIGRLLSTVEPPVLREKMERALARSRCCSSVSGAEVNRVDRWG